MKEFIKISCDKGKRTKSASLINVEMKLTLHKLAVLKLALSNSVFLTIQYGGSAVVQNEILSMLENEMNEVGLLGEAI